MLRLTVGKISEIESILYEITGFESISQNEIYNAILKLIDSLEVPAFFESYLKALATIIAFEIGTLLKIIPFNFDSPPPPAFPDIEIPNDFDPGSQIDPEAGEAGKKSGLSKDDLRQLRRLRRLFVFIDELVEEDKKRHPNITKNDWVSKVLWASLIDISEDGRKTIDSIIN